MPVPKWYPETEKLYQSLRQFAVEWSTNRVIATLRARRIEASRKCEVIRFAARCHNSRRRRMCGPETDLPRTRSIAFDSSPRKPVGCSPDRSPGDRLISIGRQKTCNWPARKSRRRLCSEENKPGRFPSPDCEKSRRRQRDSRNAAARTQHRLRRFLCRDPHRGDASRRFLKRFAALAISRSDARHHSLQPAHASRRLAAEIRTRSAIDGARLWT
jgi:hypothetical protein